MLAPLHEGVYQFMVEGGSEKNFGLINVGSLVKPLDTATQGFVDAAGAFLSRICLPAAEFGLLLRDQVSSWRTLNVARIAQKAEKKLRELGTTESKRAHPRLVWATLDNGSWNADDDLREMWAGLIASSCTEDGTDESNLIFINLLAQLTTSEAKLLSHVCLEAQKFSNPVGVVGTHTVELTKERLSEVTGVTDLHQINRELAHLNALGLVKGGFGWEEVTEWTESYSHLDLEDQIISVPNFDVANVSPTHLGISLYVRCEGSLLPAAEFFSLSP